VRNRLYDAGVKKSVKFDIPIVCVGNITVGGTGKTPMCELLVEHFSRDYRVALLSRGYGRRTKGYLEVETNMSYRNTGDEPKQIKMKYPDTVVVVCKNRIEGVERIRREHPEVGLILLDDGFQYRRLCPKLNMVMVDYTRPIDKDSLLPAGNLRDQRRQMKRAHYVVVTKCPARMTPLDRRIMRNRLELLPFQNLSYTRTVAGAPYPAFAAKTGDESDGVNGEGMGGGNGEGMGGARTVSEYAITAGGSVVAMAAIGNPTPFVEGLKARYDVVGELLFRDHHPYTVRDLKKMEAVLDGAPAGTVIVTTEKDAVKLGRGTKIPKSLRERIFVLPVRMGFLEETREDFLKKLDYDVRTDQKHSFFYSR
jgi:tetraacyldisaccharide 4'-kinase